MYQLGANENIVDLNFSELDANTQFAVKLFSTELQLPGWQDFEYAEKKEIYVAGGLVGPSGPTGYGLVDTDLGVIAAMAIYPRSSVFVSASPMGYSSDRIYTDIFLYAKHPAYEHSYILPKLLGHVATIALAQENQTGIGIDLVLAQGDEHIPHSVWFEHGFEPHADQNVPYKLPMERVYAMAAAASIG